MLIGLKKFYRDNKEEICISYNTLMKYIKEHNEDFKGLKIVSNSQRKSYYVIDEELFLNNFVLSVSD